MTTAALAPTHRQQRGQKDTWPGDDDELRAVGRPRHVVHLLAGLAHRDVHRLLLLRQHEVYQRLPVVALPRRVLVRLAVDDDRRPRTVAGRALGSVGVRGTELLRALGPEKAAGVCFEHRLPGHTISFQLMRVAGGAFTLRSLLTSD